MASTREGYLALIRQTTQDVAVKPTHFIRFKDGDIMYKDPITGNNPIQKNRWNAITPVSGEATSEGSYNIDLDVNECVHFLSAALGSMSSADISSETDGSVYKHTIDHSSGLPSLTIEQGKGNLDDVTNNLQNYQVDRAFGAMVDVITISGATGVINMEVALKALGVFQKSDLISDATAGASVDVSLNSVEGLTTDDTVNIFDETPQNETDAIVAISTTNKTIQIATLGNSYTVANNGKVELVPQTPSYSAQQKVLNFDDCNFQFGADLTASATAAEENIENWSLEFNNQLEERYGSKRKTPSVIAPKGNSAKLSYTKYFENVQERDRYLNKAKRAGILTITNNAIVSTTDINEAKETVKFLFSDLRFTEYDMPTGTDELYAVSVEAEAFYNSTDGRALRIEVTNEKAGTEYTA